MMQQSSDALSGSETARASILRDGLTAGVLGATAVAVLFFVVDLLRGRPFLVPAGLGHALLHGLGLSGTEGIVAHVMAYTVFHYLAFALAGILAATIARRAEQEPGLLVGGFLLFSVFEAGFLALSSVIALGSVLGSSAWLLVTMGNVLAALVMGWSLWRTHPNVLRQWNLAMSGRDDLPAPHKLVAQPAQPILAPLGRRPPGDDSGRRIG